MIEPTDIMSEENWTQLGTLLGVLINSPHPALEKSQLFRSQMDKVKAGLVEELESWLADESEPQG